MIFYGENSEVINLGLVYKSPITEQQLKERVASQQNEAALEVIRESVRTEKQARIDADSNLKNELRDYVDSETSAREISETNIVVRIDRETSLRIAADNQLSNDIASEERARTAEILRLDDALENERVARATSESAMKSDIMTAISEMEGRNTNADSALTEATKPAREPLKIHRLATRWRLNASKELAQSLHFEPNCRPRLTQITPLALRRKTSWLTISTPKL